MLLFCCFSLLLVFLALFQTSHAATRLTVDGSDSLLPNGNPILLRGFNVMWDMNQDFTERDPNYIKSLLPGVNVARLIMVHWADGTRNNQQTHKPYLDCKILEIHPRVILSKNVLMLSIRELLGSQVVFCLPRNAKKTTSRCGGGAWVEEKTQLFALRMVVEVHKKRECQLMIECTVMLKTSSTPHPRWWRCKKMLHCAHSFAWESWKMHSKWYLSYFDFTRRKRSGRWISRYYRRIS